MYSYPPSLGYTHTTFFIVLWANYTVLPAKLNYFGYLNQCSLNLEIKPFCKSRDKLSEIWNLLGGVWNQIRGVRDGLRLSLEYVEGICRIHQGETGITVRGNTDYSEGKYKI